MKGILLAGGTGARLHPMTRAISMHLLPVYDKPMIYYPLSVLIRAGVRDVLFIVAPRDLNAYRLLLGNGGRLGMRFSYAAQDEPRGTAEALIIGERFARGHRIALILGDNVFWGTSLPGALLSLSLRNDAAIFACAVREAQYYAVAELDGGGNVLSIEEKPAKPKSAYAVPGLYFYPPDAPRIARAIRPGKSGMLEITSVNQVYLSQGRLHAHVLPGECVWMDAGTHQRLLQCANRVSALQQDSGASVGCIEQAACDMGYIRR